MIASIPTRNFKPFYPMSFNKSYILNFPVNLVMDAGNTYVFDYL